MFKSKNFQRFSGNHFSPCFMLSCSLWAKNIFRSPHLVKMEVFGNEATNEAKNIFRSSHLVKMEVFGNEATKLHKRLISLNSQKRGAPFSKTMSHERRELRFSILRTTFASHQRIPRKAHQLERRHQQQHQHHSTRDTIFLNFTFWILWIIIFFIAFFNSDDGDVFKLVYCIVALPHIWRHPWMIVLLNLFNPLPRSWVQNCNTVILSNWSKYWSIDVLRTVLRLTWNVN